MVTAARLVKTRSPGRIFCSAPGASWKTFIGTNNMRLDLSAWNAIQVITLVAADKDQFVVRFLLKAFAQ